MHNMKHCLWLWLFTALLVVKVLADHYFVKEGDRVCIIMDTNITGKVTFETISNTTESYHFNVTTHDSRGKCFEKNEKQIIEIRFYPNGLVNTSMIPWSIELKFARENFKSFLLDFYKLTAIFYEDSFNTTETTKVYVGSEKSGADAALSGDGSNAFRCSGLILELDNDSFLTLENLRVIAFANSSTTEFSKEQTFVQCALDARTSEIVPIVVGSCLAMLVILVLIAYLIGRARSKRQGYASV